MSGCAPIRANIRGERKVLLEWEIRLPKAAKIYVRTVDAVNRTVGRLAMYLIFAMMGILLYSSISRTVFDMPLIWVVEMAQFLMVAYYLLGGGYSMQLDSHVRMDLLYGNWSPKTKAVADAITALFLIFYLVFLLYGGFSSTEYAVKYGETSYSTWSPLMAPIKIIMTVGVALMLLQAIGTFFKDWAKARGETLP